MMTDKIIMGLIFFLVVLIVVAVVLYSIFGKKDKPTGNIVYIVILMYRRTNNTSIYRSGC